jgi:O-antigen ligase
VGQQQSDVPGRIVAWVIGLTPVLLLLLTWGETFEPWQIAMRSLALPIVVAEALIVAVAALHRPRPRFSWLWIVIGALLILAWTTAVTAERPVTSTIRTGIWSLHLLYGFSVFCLWRRGVLKAESLVDALLAGFAIFTALLVAFIASHYRPDHNWVNKLPAYSNMRWYAAYAAAAVSLAAAGIGKGKPDRIAIATLAWTVAFWTGARGPLMAVGGGLLVGALVVPALRDRSLWLRLACVLIASLVLAGVATKLAPLGEYGPQRLSEFGDAGRIQLWRSMIAEIFDRPWFGWGEAQVRVKEIGAPSLTQPHNVVLQVLHAWGIVGFVLVSVLALWLLRQMRRGIDEQTLPFATAALAIAAYSLISGSLYHVQSVSIFVLCAACLAANAPPSSSPPLPRSPSPEAPRQPDPSSAA